MVLERSHPGQHPPARLGRGHHPLRRLPAGARDLYGLLQRDAQRASEPHAGDPGPANSHRQLARGVRPPAYRT